MTFRIQLTDIEHRRSSSATWFPRGESFSDLSSNALRARRTLVFTGAVAVERLFQPRYPFAQRGTAEDSSRSDLATLEKNHKWVAYYPLGEPTEEKQSGLSGLVYLYTGKVAATTVRGQVQYGVQYELRLRRRISCGRIRLVDGFFGVERPSGIPSTGQDSVEEWFDWRPIPEITGPNSTDPNLLGIPEHVKP